MCYSNLCGEFVLALTVTRADNCRHISTDVANYFISQHFSFEFLAQHSVSREEQTSFDLKLYHACRDNRERGCENSRGPIMKSVKIYTQNGIALHKEYIFVHDLHLVWIHFQFKHTRPAYSVVRKKAYSSSANCIEWNWIRPPPCKQLFINFILFTLLVYRVFLQKRHRKTWT